MASERERKEAAEAALGSDGVPPDPKTLAQFINLNLPREVLSDLALLEARSELIAIQAAMLAKLGVVARSDDIGPYLEIAGGFSPSAVALSPDELALFSTGLSAALAAVADLEGRP